MSTKISNWPAATPMWVDLGVDDLAAAKSYYADLFGWDFTPGDPEAGEYSLAHVRGRAVAGVGPKQDPGAPTVWITFLASDDVNVTAKKISAAGGELIAPPFDVMESGRMALAADSVGATFGVWQAGTHIGAERVNEHGTLCWNELRTRDFASARSFYAEVFDVSYQDVSKESLTYSTIRRPLDGREVGGVQHDLDLAPNTPNHWLTWFASDYVQGTADRAVELGSSLLMPVTETALGRMAIIQAPQGEVFGIIDAPRIGE
ncbi:VOC family protein [Paenarthrobacter aurescens]|uniref:Glyoxalase n=1 Tax=Paenarthrobacter aurescens TaxID=43663 RepID=A0A4Y3NL71_PAEAU|nr:VOC family protein [Paenarthrobacter aurescens]UKA49821.1 VOC family protein [Arthrobacter sp. FW305-123]MDO6145492.1 VOC family protein [Paenarthrobacter aurescens]MDO6149301.1 VOC family protein [Paenarthrobacter aurescens]MDO6160541.1 VOC family protein [Paenarthrobacter aurescens]MDO6164400.1 VOC family protein [Paenarthrobacter aurescens]